jgi:hypothetical protein
MRFTLEHRFDAPVGHVVSVANSEDFQVGSKASCGPTT